jgi:hypothetical protein
MEGEESECFYSTMLSGKPRNVSSEWNVSTFKAVINLPELLHLVS